MLGDKAVAKVKKKKGERCGREREKRYCPSREERKEGKGRR